MTKPAWLILLGVVAGLLAAGILYLVTRPPVGEAVVLLPPPTVPPLVVYVSGEVNNPGIYNLSLGSRLVDAIEAAGGMTTQADTQTLNLAQVLTDGMRIEVPDLLPVGQGTSGDDISRGSVSVSILVNINTATSDELEALPEIGPHLAQEIISYREANGPFESIDEIMEVPGIGTITFNTIRDLITVEEQP